MPSRRPLVLECAAIFGLLPPALALLKPHGYQYAVLWVVAFLAWRSLVRRGYRFKRDWNGGALTPARRRRILRRFMPFAAALVLFTLVAIPDHFLSLPRHKPGVWVLVVLLYPLLSVVPQEIVFRSFFFRRYAPLFPGPRSMIAASALAFGWMHVVLLNKVAVVFSAFGGALFASTYRETRSLAAACAEHALYGCTVFTLGLGYYFYHGQAVH